MRENPLPEVWRHANVAAEWYDVWAAVTCSELTGWEDWVRAGPPGL